MSSPGSGTRRGQPSDGGAGVPAQLGVDLVAALLDQDARRRSWLQILVALAQSQATLGIIPAQAGDDVAQHADPSRLDVELVAARTRATSHSTLGLIEALTTLVPERSREFVYYGATVQDLTDTWFALVMRDTSALVRRDLERVREACGRPALEHRSTPMAGRTHGQPGTPITFGLKAATWADEVDRSLERLSQGTARWSTVQLAGSTGGLAFFGDDGPALRAAFAARLGLADPGISWTSSRDRTAEFGTTLALVTGALARIGDEVYEHARHPGSSIALAMRRANCLPGSSSSLARSTTSGSRC